MERKGPNIILIIITLIVGIAFIYNAKEMLFPEKTPNVEQIQDEDITQTEETENDTKVEMFVNVFFIGQNKNGEEVYKAVKRKYAPEVDGTPIKFSITTLIDGPKPEEVKLGVYSEIPVGTKLLNVVDNTDGVYINLSKHFEMGGGTDSLYKRLFQLIKTAKYNTNKPVYLLIENNIIEVIGGEGIMISQPLTETSIGG